MTTNTNAISTEIMNLVKAENDLNSANVKALATMPESEIFAAYDAECARHNAAISELRNRATNELLIPHNIHLQF